LDTYTSLTALPPAMYACFVREFTQWLDHELEGVQIYPECVDTLMDCVVRKVRLVEPAKSVGIICGQSIGEMQTQTTLNTFHKTGLTEKLVVAGVPRFLEIIDTNRSETQGTPSAYIYFRSPLPQSIAETRARVGSSLVSYTLEKLIVDWSIETEVTTEPWDVDDLHAHPTVCSYPWHLRLHLNREILFRYTLTLDQVAQRIIQAFPTYILRCSPLFLGRIDVFPLHTFADPSALEDQIYPSLIHIPVCGVERIQNIFFLRTSTTPVEWYLETDGSNLEEVLNLPFVDSFRTYSNDIWEIYNLFGIEAVRAYIVEELTQLMPTIHRTHITLLADRMTVSGRLRSISRYTRKHEQSSVLSKATFEETLSGFLRSGMMNEVDTVNGSSASIICGRIPKVGTGLNDLVL
jgi:DNA-directed RNA polymerase II subunit RPB1